MRELAVTLASVRLAGEMTLEELPVGARAALGSLVPNDLAHRALFMAVLEGKHAGRVIAWRGNPGGSGTLSAALIASPTGFVLAVGSPGGDAEGRCTPEKLGEAIFGRIVHDYAEPEVILFAAREEWLPAIEAVLLARHGARISRRVFALDYARFDSAVAGAAPLPAPYHLSVESSDDAFSAEVRHEGRVVSRCSAIAIAGGCAELDVATVGAHRRKGLAKAAAIAAISEARRRGLTPAWSCWPYRTESAALAGALGYLELEPVPAYVWTPNL